MFADQGLDRYGFIDNEQHVRLYRNGELLGERDTVGIPSFAVPPERGHYRLEIVAERGAPFQVSTKVSGAWEFSSEYVDGFDLAAVLVTVVRFSPRLNDANTAPKNRTFEVPVTVQTQDGTSAAKAKLTSVEVSYDDGAVWRPATVKNGEVILYHPAQAGFVSLRARAADTVGNTVEQTIIRAYRIGWSALVGVVPPGHPHQGLTRLIPIDERLVCLPTIEFAPRRVPGG